MRTTVQLSFRPRECWIGIRYSPRKIVLVHGEGYFFVRTINVCVLPMLPLRIRYVQTVPLHA